LWVGTGKEWYVDLLYVNQRDGTFASVAMPSLVGNPARGSATADYDGDGAVDLYVWNLGVDSRLYVNAPREDHHWLELKLVGAGSNTEAIGAVARVVADATSQLRRVSGGDGAHSQSSSILHFGLGQDSGPVRVEITWPGGATQTVADVPIDRLVRIDATGVVPDRLVDPVATWSAGTLTVTTRSAYGGRTGLRTPFGPLVWDPESLSFTAGFAVTEPPTAVQITSALGLVFEIPVDAVP
ncbi:MAG: CRTAC1 family protein, partial [Myxococcota bacterium]